MRPVISATTSARRGGARGQPDGDRAAVLEHGHPVADACGSPPAGGRCRRRRRPSAVRSPDDPEEVVDLVVVEDGGRLVHDDQPGVVGQRPGHADDLLAGGRQSPDLARRRDLGVAEPGAAAGGPSASWSPRCTKPALARLVAEEDVLGHRQPVDQVELLVDRGDAAASSRRSGVDSVTGSPCQRISPASGWWAPGEHLDQRGLAGAVLAEQAVHLAGPHSRSTPSSARTPGNSLTMPRHG